MESMFPVFIVLQLGVIREMIAGQTSVSLQTSFKRKGVREIDGRTSNFFIRE